MNYQRFIQCMTCFIVVLFQFACSAPQAPFAPVSATSPIAGKGQEQFTDPFAYCKAVGTIDVPDERYAGPKVPEEIVEGLRKALEMSDDASIEWLIEGTAWRCMDGKVWGCFIGANLPCASKADTSRTPTVTMEDFCEANPNADVIPAVVTGRETVYTWRCIDGFPRIVKQIFEPDVQGFISNFWYEINPK